MTRKQGERRSRGWVALAAVAVLAAVFANPPGGGDEEKVLPPTVTAEAQAPDRTAGPGGQAAGTPADGDAPATAEQEEAAGATSPGAGAGPVADTPGPAAGAPGAEAESPARTPGAEAESAADAPAADGAATPGRRLKATVTRVVDGDTLDVLIDGREERVRMIGVDTPEVYGKAEPYGAEASAFTKQRLTGKEVSLELDAEARDQYGRLLAYVWIGDELFNATLVREGYAQVMTIPPNVKYAERFVALQRQAREAGSGLWGLPDEGGGAPAGNGAAVSGSPGGSGAAASGAPVSGVILPVNGDCGGLIKGNISASGEKIYHVPGGQFYDRTYAEACFATRADAEAAGYRASKR